MRKLRRRDALRFPLALGLVAALTGCDEEIAGWGGSTTTPTPEPSPPCAAPPRPHRIEEIGVELDISVGCGKNPPRRSQYLGGGNRSDPVPQWHFDGFTVYLLPDDVKADPAAPINGRHGFYRSVDQLVEGERLPWDDGPTISYGRHTYSEYTNRRTDFDDYFAFITPARAPKPSHSTLTIARHRVREGDPAPERELRRLATSVRVL